MPLNPSKGNMYPFVTHTFNTIKGKCPHGCIYCYCKKWGEQSRLHFDDKELKTDLGKDNFIFVGSSCDMWASQIQDEWIYKTTNHCRQFENKYLFQTKDTEHLFQLRTLLPQNSVIGTTIETDQAYDEMGDTPSVIDRAEYLSVINYIPKMVTIEPIMDFNLIIMVELIKGCNPEWVNIGANTAHWVDLPEPPKEKILELIEALKEFTEVKIKKNLKRLIGESTP